MRTAALDLPDNIQAIALHEREWNGVLVETAHFQCDGRAVHLLCHQDRTRLSVVLEEEGGRCEPRLAENARCPTPYAPRHMAFAPAGLPVWGYSDHIHRVRDATLCFDVEALSERLGERLDATLAGTPRLGFTDARVWTLARLLADACDDPDPASQLYGDGLVTALGALLLRPRPEAATAGTLAPWQLRRVVDHLQARLPARVELRELADLVGLSQAHFSRAFKASTGRAPYQWQLDERIRRVQARLRDSEASLDRIAEATGFVDSAHLVRTFRRFVGTTPSRWRRENRV